MKFLKSMLLILGVFGLVGTHELHSQSVATESPPDSQGRTLLYFPLAFLPLDYDLAGSWRLEPLFGTPQTAWPFSKLTPVNYAMYGRDSFKLVRTKVEVQTYPSPETTVVRVHYTGFYRHTHATGRTRPMAVSESGSSIGTEVNYNCFQEEFVFPIAGYLSIYQRAGRVVDLGLNLQGTDGKGFPRALHPSVYDQGADYGIPGYALFQNRIGDLLAANFVVSHAVAEPASTDPCNLLLRDQSTLQQVIYGEDGSGRPTNRAFFAYFRRESAPIPEGAKGVIHGKIQDQSNNISITNAIVRLYRQDRYVRPRTQGEASLDYSRYVESRVTRLMEVRADSSGAFEFPEVPLLYRRFEGEGSEMAVANYSLQVVNAEADGSFLGNPSLNVIHYQPRFVPNVEPKEPTAEPLIIKLQAETAFAAKTDLVLALTNSSPNNYLKIDGPVIAYMDKLQSGAVEYTPDREEGLKRAIWAERAVREGVSRADQFIGAALDGLGTLLADVYGALFDYASKDVKEGAEFLHSVRNGAAGPIHTSFKLPSGPDWIAATDKMFQAGRKFELYDGAEKMLKTLSAGFQSGLIAAGMDSPKAVYMADTIHLVMKTIVAAIKSNHALGATLEFQKVVIQEMTKQMAPVLLDNSLEINLHQPWKQTWQTDDDLHKVLATLPSLPSYCKLTAPSLELSVQKMESWAVHDREKYLIDVNKAAAIIESMNQTATALAQAMEYSKAAAKTADAVADFAGVISTVSGENPYAKALETTASITKWMANVTTTIAPMAFVFVEAPARVDEAVRLAFGISTAASPDNGNPSLSGFALRRTANTALPPTLPTTLSAARSQLNTAARRLSLALKTNDMGAAILAASDGTNSHLATLALFQRTLRQATVQSSGLPQTNQISSLAASDLALLEIGFGLHARGFSGQIARFFASILGGAFTNTDDQAYQQRRNEVLTSLQSLSLAVDNAVSSISTQQSDNRQKQHLPAIMVELDPPVSEKTGGNTLSSPGERFVLRAHISNLSALPLSNLSARLKILAQPGWIQLLSPTNQPVANGVLQAMDSRQLSGLDEADVQWSFTCPSNINSGSIHLSVDLLESGDSPQSFVHAAASQVLSAAQELADRDLDGLPNDYEIAHGLDPDRPDALEDPDGDGLTNQAEFALHTDPKRFDTDGDGLSDGYEVRSSRTNPLVADSDEDGVPDGTDGEPLNPSSQTSVAARPEPVVGIELTTARLNQTNRTVNLIITNRGEGTLLWAAKSENPALVDVYPPFPTTSFAGDSLTISLPQNYVSTNNGTVLSRVRVIDMGGKVRDFVDILVVTEGTLPGPRLPSSFSRIQVLADGTVVLTLSGEPGARHVLESSGRMDQWNPLAVVTNLTGSVQYLDRPPAGTAARYYRSSTKP